MFGGEWQEDATHAATQEDHMEAAAMLLRHLHERDSLLGGRGRKLPGRNSQLEVSALLQRPPNNSSLMY
jgi:hypothetical protein